MMAFSAAAERTEAEWKDLLRSVGLKVVGIWTKDAAVESLIEAVLEDDDTDHRFRVLDNPRSSFEAFIPYHSACDTLEHIMLK